MSKLLERIKRLEALRKHLPAGHPPEYQNALDYWAAHHARFDLIAPDHWSESEKASLYEVIETGKRMEEWI